MFKMLDADMLGELTRLDDRSTLSKQTRLSDLLACLEQVSRECRTPGPGNSFSPNDAETIATGVDAAQRIVEKVWNDAVT